MNPLTWCYVLERVWLVIEVLEDTLATFVPCVWPNMGFRYVEVLAQSDGDIDLKQKEVPDTHGACLKEHS